MAASFRDGAVVGLCLMVMVVVGSIEAEAELSTQLTIDFYDDSCPQIYDIVKAEIRKAVAAEARKAASLVRLHFHDCFVNGCDGSILLNSTPGFHSEQEVIANNDSIRGFPVIDSIKAKLEAACPETVSCADIVAIASRDSAVEAGLFPAYPVFFGRRDSLTANFTQANQSLPAPTFDYAQLKKNFADVGLDEVDLVTLSGAHSIGKVHCRVLNITQIKENTTVGFNPIFKYNNLKSCGNDGEKLLNLDHFSPDLFDNWYYINLLKGDTNFISDQVLLSTPGGINRPLVEAFAANPLAFGVQFGISSIKMGNIKPLTGKQGEIRKQCAFPNKAKSSSESAASLIALQ